MPPSGTLPASPLLYCMCLRTTKFLHAVSYLSDDLVQKPLYSSTSSGGLLPELSHLPRSEIHTLVDPSEIAGSVLTRLNHHASGPRFD
jgi:hypothetical protein